MDFDPEPGFYWGAMYITYGFNAGLVISAALVLYFFFNNPELWVYLVVIGAFSLALAPAFFRYSRVILLYGLGGKKFNPELFKRKA